MITGIDIRKGILAQGENPNNFNESMILEEMQSMKRSIDELPEVMTRHSYSAWVDSMPQEELEELVEDHMGYCKENCTSTKDVLRHEWEVNS